VQPRFASSRTPLACGPTISRTLWVMQGGFGNCLAGVRKDHSSKPSLIF